MHLLSDGKKNRKIGKNRDKSYQIFSLNLKPYKSEINGQIKNVCPFATSCIKLCVGKNGHFRYKNGSAFLAQKRRTELFFNDPEKFYIQLFEDIKRAEKLALKRGAVAVFRLNAYSDLNHEKLSLRFMDKNIYSEFSKSIFYDYTKDYKKALENKNDNYKITYSFNERTSIEQVNELMSNNINVAVVFKSFPLPETFLGYNVINGDVNDNRFIDKNKSIVGLKFKGYDKELQHGLETGFIIDNN